MKMAGCLLGCSAVQFGSHRPDDRGSTDLLNVGKLMPEYTALQPRRQPSSVRVTLFDGDMYLENETSDIRRCFLFNLCCVLLYKESHYGELVR
jgi:hypothetical protein